MVNKELIDAYSMILGFWKPSPNDNSEYVNKIRILVATIELDNKVHTEISQDELFDLLNN